MITLTDEQNGAVKAVKEWFLSAVSKIKPFVLAGYAGTGKTSILPFVKEELKLSDYSTHLCAFTGKAAMVLRKKGLHATTIHSFIYDPYLDGRGKLRFKLKACLRQGLKLIIVDEASMVSTRLKEDLESFGIPILYVGDHGQLPPISKDQINLMLNPDYRLEKIHRQALDNPIIQVATMVRKGYKLKYGDYGDTVKRVRAPLDSMLLEVDQLICGKNITRRQLNHRMRTLLGYGDDIYPVINDKLICLKNNNENGLVNGMIGTCRGFSKTYFELDFGDDDGNLWDCLEIDPLIFKEGKQSEYQKGIEQFDFGYCITCHKSQGSEFPYVLLFEEMLGGDMDMYIRWLYTGITRASERLILVG